MTLRSYYVIFLLFLSPATLQAQDSLRHDRNEHPDHNSFTLSTDQRFTFFKDEQTALGRPRQVSIWGIQAGVFWRSNWRTGVGLYFTNHSLGSPQPFANDTRLTGRQLRFATLFAEKFIIRRRLFDISLPVEAGFGLARYDLEGSTPDARMFRRGTFIPIGVGTSVSFKFPPIGRFKPTRWLGVNMLIGYRYAIQNTVPDRFVNYNGIYYSIGPAFMFDRFTTDFNAWRRKRRGR